MRALIDRAPVAFRQIVKDGDLMALVYEQLRADAADVTSAADNQDFHRPTWDASLWPVKRKNVKPQQLSLFVFQARNHAANASHFSAAP